MIIAVSLMIHSKVRITLRAPKLGIQTIHLPCRTTWSLLNLFGAWNDFEPVWNLTDEVYEPFHQGDHLLEESNSRSKVFCSRKLASFQGRCSQMKSQQNDGFNRPIKLASTATSSKSLEVLQKTTFNSTPSADSLEVSMRIWHSDRLHNSISDSVEQTPEQAKKRTRKHTLTHLNSASVLLRLQTDIDLCGGF